MIQARCFAQRIKEQMNREIEMLTQFPPIQIPDDSIATI